MGGIEKDKFWRCACIIIFFVLKLISCQCFIKNFYADNAARLLRADMLIYTILAYLAIFRIDELGFPLFKEFAMTQDPTKVYNFASYLFNKVWLIKIIE
jgi:hypothetical protein